jgi:hypothetical protein
MPDGSTWGGVTVAKQPNSLLDDFTTCVRYPSAGLFPSAPTGSIAAETGLTRLQPRFSRQDTATTAGSLPGELK